jgi:lipopolysaccharide transport system permease protein
LNSLLSVPADLLKNKGLILASVKRDFQIRYRNSMLGWLWLILQPLSMILIYTLIFSQIMRAKIPNADSPFAYMIFLCTGTLTWSFFLEMITRGQNMFLENANVLKKVQYPRICLPAIVCVTSSLNFLITFGIFLVVLLVAGAFPSWTLVALLPLLALQIVLALGIGLTLGVLNVFFRDVGQIMGIVIQLWFWGTPIVYPLSIVPAWAQPLIMLNPMAPLVINYQNVMLHQQLPDWNQLTSTLLWTLFFCTFAVFLFKKHSADMVDEL